MLMHSDDQALLAKLHSRSKAAAEALQTDPSDAELIRAARDAAREEREFLASRMVKPEE